MLPDIKLKTETPGVSVKVIGMRFARRMKKNGSRPATAHLPTADLGETARENETKIRLWM